MSAKAAQGKVAAMNRAVILSEIFMRMKECILFCIRRAKTCHLLQATPLQALKVYRPVLLIAN